MYRNVVIIEVLSDFLNGYIKRLILNYLCSHFKIVNYR